MGVLGALRTHTGELGLGSSQPGGGSRWFPWGTAKEGHLFPQSLGVVSARVLYLESLTLAFGLRPDSVYWMS